MYTFWVYIKSNNHTFPHNENQAEGKRIKQCRFLYMSHMQKSAHVPSINNVWTKYGEPRLYGNGKTDLIMKT